MHRTFRQIDPETLTGLWEAMAEVRAKVWSRAGATTGDDMVVLDIDSSLHEVHSDNMRAHAHVEDHIQRLKDSGPSRFPFAGIDANRAWLAVVCFADALVRWFQLFCLDGELASAQPKRLRWTLWHTPARAVRTPANT